MRVVDPAVATALAQRRLIARDFVWFRARDRVTGLPVEDAYWSGLDDIDAQVILPRTAQVVTRTYRAGVGLISIGAIPLVGNLTVQTVQIRLAQIDEHIETLLRIYDPRQADVEVHRGLFDPATGAAVSALFPRFLGFVDRVELTTPREGGEGGLTATCVSDAQEMGRSNPERRSDAEQRRRSATDDFFADASTIGDLQIFWGTAKS